MNERKGFEGELQGLRAKVQMLETENYQLRARLSKCTCSAGEAAIAPASNEQQIDLVAALSCSDCD